MTLSLGDLTMYARITTTQVSPYRLDESVTIARERVVPVAKQQKGYKGYLMLVDRSTGKCMTITLWEGESEREITGEASSYYQDALAQIVPLLSAEPGVEDMEIVIQE
jgi:quinol monooxygenase YgiN